MTAFQYNRKYKNKSTDGFPSKLEAAVYHWLCLREKNGEISDIKRQCVVKLSAADINYKADFSYVDVATKKTIWVEAKGFPTDVWLLKKKLWTVYGPGPLEIWTGNYKNPSLKEVIKPKNDPDGGAAS